MARMKGRLLKGGEPDREGVAKVILSDWVRGRIPYFVPPPERSEELNVKEQKERERKEKEKARTGKGKAKEEEARVPGVKQNLGSIMQKMNFVAEDVRPLEVDETAEGQEVNDDEEDGESDQGEDQEGMETEDGDKELAWNDVFPEGEAETMPQSLPEGFGVRAPQVPVDSDDGSLSGSDSEGRCPLLFARCYTLFG